MNCLFYVHRKTTGRSAIRREVHRRLAVISLVLLAGLTWLCVFAPDPTPAQRIFHGPISEGQETYVPALRSSGLELQQRPFDAHPGSAAARLPVRLEGSIPAIRGPTVAQGSQRRKSGTHRLSVKLRPTVPGQLNPAPEPNDLDSHSRHEISSSITGSAGLRRRMLIRQIDFQPPEEAEFVPLETPTVDELTVDELTVDELTVDEPTVDESATTVEAVTGAPPAAGLHLVQSDEDDADPFVDEPVTTVPAFEGGLPFEVIGEAGEMQVMIRRNQLLRAKVDIYRTAVVDPSICDVVQFTPRDVSIIGKSQGATHVTFWFKNGNRHPLTYLVRVVPDPVAREAIEDDYRILQQVLGELFPDSKVELIPIADKLIVKGQAKDGEEAAQIMQIIRGKVANQVTNGTLRQGPAARVLSRAETGPRNEEEIQVINMLRVPGPHQVALRVKIAELNRSAARGFGVELDTEINLGDGGSALFIKSMLNMAIGGVAPSVLASVDGDDINIGLRYLQQEGVVRVLSEPTLVTLSGRPATFVAGGEFAVPTVVGTAGLSAVTTDFRTFGAIISFLPIVLDKDRIRLEVAPEFSKINSDLDVGGTPGLDVRAVTTTVEMREGQTLAIAGLLDNSMNGTNTGNIPLIWRWLGRKDISHNETELIILVTPELVHPMDPEEVPPLPGFDVTEPSDAEFFLGGHLEGLPTVGHRSTIWPRLLRRYRGGGPAMISGPYGHGQ